MKQSILILSAIGIFLFDGAIEAAAEPITETSIWKVKLLPDGTGKFKVEGPFAIGDPVHETLTLKALIDGGILKQTTKRKDHDAAQFIRGAFWNDDPCAQLFEENEFSPLKPSFGIVWYLDFNDAKQATSQGTDFQNLKCPLLGRSHFGDLQFLHGMADRNGVKATETAERVLAWASVSYRIAIGEIDAHKPLETDATAKALLNSIANQNALSLMRAKTATDTQARALGSFLHMIQDSYAHGHVTRATAYEPRLGAITQFLSYVDQNSDKHAHDDSWRDGTNDLERTLNIPGARDALSISTEIVKLYKSRASWANVEEYLRNGPLYVMPDAQDSGPGNYQ
ncbi:MAG: hypothetical protein HY067_07825 [Betaproteobacteria bacterium]|nr:hypothetical protein [Betaproteobacteria bacterium]